jgi:uncharacterized protein (DUF58 family)
VANPAEKFLKPEVIRNVTRLDLRAKFIVEGFLSGLHASPFQGFSVEFSEHRKYSPGDNISDIDWSVFAKTDRFYIKRYQAETNLTGYLLMDLSASMGYTYRQELTKFEYAISLAAALGYLMVQQQDPVGLIAFDEKVRESLPPKSRKTHLANILSVLARLQPSGKTDIPASTSTARAKAVDDAPGLETVPSTELFKASLILVVIDTAPGVFKTDFGPTTTLAVLSTKRTPADPEKVHELFDDPNPIPSITVAMIEFFLSPTPPPPQMP